MGAKIAFGKYVVHLIEDEKAHKELIDWVKSHDNKENPNLKTFDVDDWKEYKQELDLSKAKTVEEKQKILKKRFPGEDIDDMTRSAHQGMMIEAKDAETGERVGFGWHKSTTGSMGFDNVDNFFFVPPKVEADKKLRDKIVDHMIKGMEHHAFLNGYHGIEMRSEEMTAGHTTHKDYDRHGYEQPKSSGPARRVKRFEAHVI
jgi:hypothetical protein